MPIIWCFGGEIHPGITGLMRTTIAVWHRARVVYCSPKTFSPQVPPRGNPTLPHLRSVPDPQIWACRGIVGVKHIVADGRMCTFSDLKASYHLPNWMLFRYFQLRHAYHQQCPTSLTLESDPVERLLTIQILNAPLSSLNLHLLH